MLMRVTGNSFHYKLPLPPNYLTPNNTDDNFICVFLRNLRSGSQIKICK